MPESANIARHLPEIYAVEAAALGELVDPAEDQAVQAGRQAERLRAEFADETPGLWKAQGPLVIHHLSNQVDPATRTFAFYLPLDNQPKTFDRDGRTHFVWRYRPGQRVRLYLPVEKLVTLAPDGKTELLVDQATFDSISAVGSSAVSRGWRSAAPPTTTSGARCCARCRRSRCTATSSTPRRWPNC